MHKTHSGVREKRDLSSMRFFEFQELVRCVTECEGMLIDQKVAGFEKRIEFVKQKIEDLLTDSKESGFTHYLVNGTCPEPNGKYCSSLFLREIAEKINERLLYLCHLKSKIVQLEATFFVLVGSQKFYDGKRESALMVWENGLQRSPSEKVIHRHLNSVVDKVGLYTANDSYLKGYASFLMCRYCFEEDTDFRKRIEVQLSGASVRCIDFDDEGSIYLNCVNRHSVVKLSSDERVEWEVRFDGSIDKGRLAIPSEFGSFCFCDDRLILCDTINRQIFLLDKSGVIQKTAILPITTPLFVLYVDFLRQYHVTDERARTVFILDEEFRIIGEYRSPEEALAPVQAVYSKKINKIILASSVYMFRSDLELFDLYGKYEKTISSFSDVPCHVVKLDIDDFGAIYAIDHYRKILKVNASGEMMWCHRENPRIDRFKYVKYRYPYLYLSDFHTLRRFRVDR